MCVQGYLIRKYDVLKLGRFKYRVKDLCLDKDRNKPQFMNQEEFYDARPVIALDFCESDTGMGWESKALCRFCWSSGSTPENPCIVPCKCSGSVGYIHFHCLKNWLKCKRTSRYQDGLLTFWWKTFECELCKYAYPYMFRVNNQLYKLIDIDIADKGSYIVIESLPLEKYSSRTVHVLNFSNDLTSFNIGRGHESSVRVNDISVSRCHAIITSYADGIYLRDNQSKFGTLVLEKGK